MVYDAKGQIDKTKYVRETVAVPSVVREYTHFAKADDWTRENRHSVLRRVEEMVHCHHVYRSVDAKGKVTQDRWFRGARCTS